MYLIPAFVAFLVGSVFSYSDSLRNSRAYMPVFVTAILATGFCWVAATRMADDKNKIYVFSLAWDFVMIVAYYFIPLIVFEFKFNLGVIAGMLLMLVGMVLVKVYGN